MDAVKSIISDFAPINLSEIESLKDSVSLLKRSDTKYVFSSQFLTDLLKLLKSTYKILEIDGNRTFQYENLYFDTPGRRFYHAHHNKKLNRWKLRFRRYADSGLCYWEIKFKSNKDRTIKERFRSEGVKLALDGELLAKTMEYGPSGLKINEGHPLPALWTNYKRITLASRALKERITIDFEITFKDMKGNEFPLDGIAVAELKQEKFSLSSPFARAAKSLKIYHEPFSKYCIGMAIMYKSLKRNRFKKRLLDIEKISKGALQCL
jgi:hypothetical protein